jgi:Arc/MetJ-type ribon-helix-helix transcriptional regulator
MPSYYLDIPEDIDKKLRKLEEEGKIKSKPEFIWETVRKALKQKEKEQP